MAKNITFTIDNDADAVRIFNGVCQNTGYERNKLQDFNPAFDAQQPEDPILNPRYINIETKQEFFTRVTLSWWAGETAQAEARNTFQANKDEIEAFSVSSNVV
jgi:hypothetical protein